MPFFSFITKNVLRRPVRSVLTGLGIAVAITAVVALLGVSDGLEEMQRQLITTGGVNLIIQRAGLGQQSTARLDEAIENRLSDDPFIGKRIAKITPLLTDRGKINSSRTPLPVPLSGYRADSFVLKELHVDTGQTLSGDDDSGVLLGVALAKILEVKIGQTISIEDKPFKVVGIYTGSSPIENNSAIMLLSSLQKLMEIDNPPQVSRFDVVLTPGVLEDPQEMEQLRAAVKALRSDKNERYGLEAVTTEKYVNQSAEIRFTRVMAWVTSVIALLIGGLGMLNTMIMSVLERTQEIGILRAIGWKERRIVRMILGEALLLSVAGAVVGVIAAIVLTQVLARLPAAHGQLQPDISPYVVGIGVGMSLLVGLLGGAYPAIRGAKLPPTEALRYE